MISGYILSGGERRTLFAEGMPGAEISVCQIDNAMNQVDSAVLELPRSNIAAASLVQKNAVVEIRNDGAVVFMGEVTKPTQTVFGSVRLDLDGPLGWLQNIVKAPFSITAGSANRAAADFLGAILDQYNAGAESNRMVQLGVVSVSGNVEMDHSGEYTRMLDLFRECAQQLGGYYYTTYSSGIPKVHYVAAPSSEAVQDLAVGINVLTLEQQLDFADYASRVYATGHYYVTRTVDGQERREQELITTSVRDTDAEHSFGRVDLPYRSTTDMGGDEDAGIPDKTRAEALAIIRAEAQELLDERKTPLPTLTLTAVDLADIGADFRAFSLGTVARCVSPALGVDTQMMVQEIKRDYIDPTKSVITFGKAPRALTRMMN